jgi:hypothetical protein
MLLLYVYYKLNSDLYITHTPFPLVSFNTLLCYKHPIMIYITLTACFHLIPDVQIELLAFIVTKHVSRYKFYTVMNKTFR